MGTSVVAVFVRRSMRRARSAVVTTQLLAGRHAYRYPADVDDGGGLVRRRVDAEHMVRTRGDPDGIVIGVDRVGRVPNEFARAPRVDRRDDGVGAGSMRETVPSLPLATQTASVATARSIAGAPIPIVLMTSRRSASMRDRSSSALATQTEPCPIEGDRRFGPRARGPRPGSAAGRSQRPSREEPAPQDVTTLGDAVRQRVV